MNRSCAIKTVPVLLAVVFLGACATAPSSAPPIVQVSLADTAVSLPTAIDDFFSYYNQVMEKKKTADLSKSVYETEAEYKQRMSIVQSGFAASLPKPVFDLDVGMSLDVLDGLNYDPQNELLTIRMGDNDLSTEYIVLVQGWTVADTYSQEDLGNSVGQNAYGATLEYRNWVAQEGILVDVHDDGRYKNVVWKIPMTREMARRYTTTDWSDDIVINEDELGIRVAGSLAFPYAYTDERGGVPEFGDVDPSAFKVTRGALLLNIESIYIYDKATNKALYISQ